MATIVIYTANYCPFCRQAEALLDKKGVKYKNVDVTEDFETRARLSKETGYKTVPLIFINEKCIGGFQQLSGLESEGKLDSLAKGPDIR